MNSRIFSASFCAVFLVASASAGWSDPAPAPTPEQRHFINDCAVMSQAVLLFAKARDQGMAEMDAFTYVTRGQVTYDAGSQVGQTLQWAFDHPDEDPITVTAHFHGRCQLDAVELLTPISEAQLTSGVQTCQQDHAGKPDQIRVCIDGKANAIIASANALSSAPEATDLAVAPPPPPQRPLDTLPTPRVGKTIVPVPAPPPAVIAPTLQAPVVVAQVAVPAPTNVAAAPPPPEVQAPRVAALTAPAGAAIPSLPPPPPAEVPAPAPTLVAAVPPPAVQAPKLAMAAVPAGAALAPVPAPPFAPEPTSVAVAPPPVTHASTVAMVAVPAAAALAPVSVPPPAPEPTDIATTPPPAIPVPQVAAVTVPSGVALAPPAVVLPPAPTAPAPLSVASVPVASAQTPAPVPAAPVPEVPQLDVANALPASMAGIGKLSLGMSMDDAVKAMGSYGQDDTDEQGNPARTFLISDGHGYIELITEAGKPDVVYGIEYHGGADAKVPPILGVHLGDGAAEVLTHVGEPTSRSPAVFDRTLWSYDGRNYSFELSSGGDLITIRIAGYAGLASAAAPADGTPVPSAP